MEAKMKRVLVVFLLLVFAVTILAKGKNTKLLYATSNGDLVTAQKLISKGADVNAKDNNGKTEADYLAFYEELQKQRYQPNQPQYYQPWNDPGLRAAQGLANDWGRDRAMGH
jgi:ankyrin repeat protein